MYRHINSSLAALVVLLVFALPEPALAQTSPFQTGVTSLQTNIYAWGVPLAVIAIMVLAIMAWAQRLSWGMAISTILGIVIFFGAPTFLTWIRGMAAV